MAAAKKRTRAVTVKRYRSAADADRDDLQYWLQLSDAERVLQVWRLSLEQWTLRGELSDERGLRRSVARIHRG
jgi:hypothetical protein